MHLVLVVACVVAMKGNQRPISSTIPFPPIKPETHFKLQSHLQRLTSTHFPLKLINPFCSKSKPIPFKFFKTILRSDLKKLQSLAAREGKGMDQQEKEREWERRRLGVRFILVVYDSWVREREEKEGFMIQWEKERRRRGLWFRVREREKKGDGNWERWLIKMKGCLWLI